MLEFNLEIIENPFGMNRGGAPPTKGECTIRVEIININVSDKPKENITTDSNLLRWAFSLSLLEKNEIILNIAPDDIPYEIAKIEPAIIATAPI